MLALVDATSVGPAVPFRSNESVDGHSGQWRSVTVFSNLSCKGGIRGAPRWVRWMRAEARRGEARGEAWRGEARRGAARRGETRG